MQISARPEAWPLTRPFRISRGSKTSALVVVVEVREGLHTGRGECVPYARYGESVESVITQITGIADAALTREALQLALPPGAARNAVDCALWDLEAKRSGRSVAELIGAPAPDALVTAVTVSLDTPERMAAAAAALAAAPLIKVKLDAEAPLVALRAVRSAAPGAQLIADPNEGWSPALLFELLPALAELRVAVIEQPIPADQDSALESLTPAVPICADESAHTSSDLDRIARRYQAVNIKLDKAGGLTEALAMRARARALGLQIMVGCMVSTSLSIAPAVLLAHDADFVDLDGPWWLREDRTDAMRFIDGRLVPPRGGWGSPE